MAICGSTNAVLHLSAIAYEAELGLNVVEEFEKLSKTTPQIAKVNPAAKWDMEAFHRAGGIPRVEQRLGDLLETSVMSNAQAEMKKAVECGLWPLYRYNPDKAEKPFSLDYKAPSRPVSEFLDGEVRYSGLKLKYPEAAETLFAQAQKDADERYRIYVKLEKSFNED